MIDGKAALTREDYCDGLGDCLPECPTGAIRFEEREAPAYDEAAVLAARRQKEKGPGAKMPHAGCPGTRVRQLAPAKAENTPPHAPSAPSRLGQRPCQIQLAPGCPKLDSVDYSEKLREIIKTTSIDGTILDD